MNQSLLKDSTRRLSVCLGILLFLSGCMQVDTHVLLHEDGSATITEKFRLSRRILDMEGGKMDGVSVATYLEKPAVEKRMARMGQGMTLVSHKIQDAEEGARESVAVFKIPDINNLEYSSPYLAYHDFAENNVVKCKLEPLYKGSWTGRRAGDIMVRFMLKKNGVGDKRYKDGEKPPPGPTPKELQLVRDVRPVFRDILRGFKLRLTFQAYCGIRATGFGHRGRKSGTNRVDLIHFTDKDLDRWGGNFLDNEEVMVDLIRGEYGSQDVVTHVKDFASNQTVPVYLAWGSRHFRGRDGILFRPSHALFDKYFKGKDLTFYFDRSARKTRPATYKEIGWDPKSGNEEK